jgi:hypothetical protein
LDIRAYRKRKTRDASRRNGDKAAPEADIYVEKVFQSTSFKSHQAQNIAKVRSAIDCHKGWTRGFEQAKTKVMGCVNRYGD